MIPKSELTEMLLKRDASQFDRVVRALIDAQNALRAIVEYQQEDNLHVQKLQQIARTGLKS